MFSLALAVQWGNQALFQASVSRTEFVFVLAVFVFNFPSFILLLSLLM